MRALRVAGLLVVVAAALAAQQAPRGLKVEYSENPAGIDVTRPRFSWLLEHNERAQKQTAYQILVSRTPEVKTGDQWDSGRVASESPANAVYNGNMLASGQTYYWRVRYWDSNGKPSPYSGPAGFEMGLLGSVEWKGKWIGGGGQLRKEFTLKGQPLRARAYICGLGYYELRINGRKVGDNVLDPGWTTYPRRVLYVTHDVTPYLRQGANAVSVTLGQGWYKSRALLLQMNIDTQAGEKHLEVVTDTTWKINAGPIVSDSIYDGETYDARLETPGWDSPGYVDTAWKPAIVVDAPKGELSTQTMPPIRVTGTLAPVRTTSPRRGVYVFDMGQDFSGWVQVKVRGARGTEVRLRHSELLLEDGNINTENLRGAKATDVYILKGELEGEVYEPRFTYHGFRYVEVVGFPGTPKPGDVVGRIVNTSVAATGAFASSTPILNDIQRLVQWGIRSNLHSIPAACNQRDERIGWLADAHLTAESAMYNFDMASFYTNYLRNIHDVQASDGTLPDTVPYAGGTRPADPAWGSAYPLLVWNMYVYYGDRRILEEHYEGIKAWTDYLTKRSQNGVVYYYSYGDWVAADRTPGGLVSTFYYCWCADIAARAAIVLGKTDDADTYIRLASSIRQAFHKQFFNPESGSYGSGSQTSSLLALYLDMIPESLRGAVLSDLTSDIIYARDTHLSTGIVGTKYLLPLLSRSGRSDLAYDLATQTTYPSWGYMLANGATTLWELWQHKTGSGANSHNHPVLGSIGGWLYSSVAGINPDPAEPGYAKIRFEPQVLRDMQWASGAVDTLRGRVSIAWSREAGTLRMEVSVPVGSQAEVHVSKLGRESVEISESGKQVWGKNTFQAGITGVTAGRQTGDEVVLEIGSGHYVFESR
jgi:alpha-L-rhamnosidase